MEFLENGEYVLLCGHMAPFAVWNNHSRIDAMVERSQFGDLLGERSTGFLGLRDAFVRVTDAGDLRVGNLQALCC